MNMVRKSGFVRFFISLFCFCPFLSSCSEPPSSHSNQPIQDQTNQVQQQHQSEKLVKITDQTEVTTLEDVDATYKGYLDFFEEVYQTMAENYYQTVTREEFERFRKTFDEKIYAELQETGKSSDFIRWRSAAFLVDFLKKEEDVFSSFFPPKPAKKYEATALGKRIDLGIEGKKMGLGYVTTHVEPRSNAYEKGLRPNDLIVQIDGQAVTELEDKTIKKFLRPLENTQVRFLYISAQTRMQREITVTSREYFKQTVFLVSIPIEGIHCFEIRRFNRKTSDDLFRHMAHARQQGPIKGLILDLRGNPGGPPLAAREISSFFLPGGDQFAYFQKKNQPKAELDVPTLPEEYTYDGPIVILVDEKSGSASELFSGILQRKKRAVLMGENSAGQVMLKSMFHFDDDSMLLLVTARGHHADGAVFSFDGLIPDKYIKDTEQAQIYKYAATYLMYVRQKENTL